MAVPTEVRRKGEELLYTNTIEARANTHAEERRKGLFSSRLIKSLGGGVFLAGSAALLAGAIFMPVYSTSAALGLTAAGLAAAGWGVVTFAIGSLKGRFNKLSKA